VVCDKKMSEAGITNWQGKKVFTLATEANIRAMKLAAAVVERETKKGFTLQGDYKEYVKSRKHIRTAITTGKLDRRFKKASIMHWSSQPGEPPAIDTGNLRASIMSDVKYKDLGVTGKVGPDVEYLAANTPIGTDVNYGLYLEIGAPAANVKARPFLRPALRKSGKKIKEIFRRANG